MTKITVMSDLHLEFSSFNLINSQNADILILAGDIFISQWFHDYPRNMADDELPPYQGRYKMVCEFRQFLTAASTQFKHVIYVAGNHEFYHGKWHAGLDYLREECENYPNVHFLESDYITIDNITFIGGTLWTNCHKADSLTLYHLKSCMNDYNIIRHDRAQYRKLVPMDTVLRHRQTLEYFKVILQNVREKTPNNKVVIVGHHAPSSLSIHSDFLHDHLMNGGYYSDLSEFILDNPEIVLWCHGHMHTVSDYKIGDCRVVCNPRGYISKNHQQNSGWDPNLIIEI